MRAFHHRLRLVIGLVGSCFIGATLTSLTSMLKPQSITEARRNLSQLVREAESGESIELTRRGESVAVLIGRRQYERLAARSGRFSQAWTDFTREVELSDLAIDPDEIFNGV